MPGPPSCPEVKDKTKSSVALAWKPPQKDGGSPIKGYIVEMQDEGSTDWKKVNEGDKLFPTCECVIPNLKELRKYRFRVKAVNAAGESEPSPATSEIPVQDILGKSSESSFRYLYLSATYCCEYSKRMPSKPKSKQNKLLDKNVAKD